MTRQKEQEARQKKKKEEIAKENQMTALQVQTEVRHHLITSDIPGLTSGELLKNSIQKQ